MRQTPESYWRLRCYRGDIDYGALLLLSHASDGAAESCWRWRCRVMLVMALPRRRWPWRDVIAKSCWRWRYRVSLAMALLR
jgi:hypothetical protein